jgi:hypothetical protein
MPLPTVAKLAVTPAPPSAALIALMTSCTVASPVASTSKVEPSLRVTRKSAPSFVRTPLKKFRFPARVAGVMLRTPRSAAVVPPFSPTLISTPWIGLMMSTRAGAVDARDDAGARRVDRVEQVADGPARRDGDGRRLLAVGDLQARRRRCPRRR